VLERSNVSNACHEKVKDLYDTWSQEDRNAARFMQARFVKLTRTPFIASMGGVSIAEVKNFIKAGLVVGAI
jgi:hypothetical protein